MSRLKTVYNQMENEYIQTLLKSKWIWFLSQIVSFPGIPLSSRNVHEIFREIRHLRPAADADIGEIHRLYLQFWKNLLTRDKGSLLKSEADRRSVVSRWLDWKGWTAEVLETIGRQAEWKELAGNWEKKAREDCFPTAMDKNEIAYERWYQLTDDRQEKHKILLSGWMFHFSFKLTNSGLDPENRMEKLLQEHVACFPDDIHQLRKDFFELITTVEDGMKRRAGWAGLSIIGAGMYEDKLVELLKLRLDSLKFPKKKRVQETETSMTMNVMEEMDGMIRWMPETRHHQNTMCQTVKTLLSERCHSGLSMEKALWEVNIEPALWRARFRLEPGEEQLLEEITTVMKDLFQSSGCDCNMVPSLKVMESLASWQPKSPEVRHHWWELWKDCLVQSFSAKTSYRVQSSEVFWRGLFAINPRHPELGGLLLRWLSEGHCRPSSINSLHSLEVIVKWLETHGFPPETALETRQNLEQKVLERLSPALRRENKYFYRLMNELAFHVSASIPPDQEGKTRKERLEVMAGLLEDTAILSKLTDQLESGGLPSGWTWQPVLHDQWQKKLANMETATPSEEVEEVLAYFMGVACRDPQFQPDGLLGEKLLLLIQKRNEMNLVIMAARLGERILARMGDRFFYSWTRAVMEREADEYEKGSRVSRLLATHLHLVRKESVLRELSAVLDGGMRQKSVKTTKTTAVDRGMVEDAWLRKLIGRFPESIDREKLAAKPTWDLPPRIWSKESMAILLKNRKTPEEQNLWSRRHAPEMENRQSPVFREERGTAKVKTSLSEKENCNPHHPAMLHEKRIT